MLIKEAVKKENQDKVYFGEINNLLARLNNFNLGGIPLPIITLCYKLTTSNCYTISKLILEACPEFTFVEGSVDSMKTAGDCNGIIKNDRFGYHVWLEKDNLVYDPVLAIFFDKEFYYKCENAVVYSKHTLDEIKESSEYNKAFTLSTIEPISIFSKYRQLIILEVMKPFIEQDSWIYSKNIQEAFNEFYSTIDSKTIKKEIKQFFPNLNQSSFGDVYDELCLNPKYNEDGFQSSQKAFLSLLGRQIRELTSINSLKLNNQSEQNLENC